MEFQYKNLKGKLEHVEVTDSEVDRHIERLRQQSPAVTVITDRPSALGDELVLDYAGWRWEKGPWHDRQEILKADQQVRDELGGAASRQASE